jgi:hypothetical protein
MSVWIWASFFFYFLPFFLPSFLSSEEKRRGGWGVVIGGADGVCLVEWAM